MTEQSRPPKVMWIGFGVIAVGNGFILGPDAFAWKAAMVVLQLWLLVMLARTVAQDGKERMRKGERWLQQKRTAELEKEGKKAT